MRQAKVEKFSLQTIIEAVKHQGVSAARSALSDMAGAKLDITGKVQKLARRDGVCRLVIQPSEAPGFVVFADCRTDAETVKNQKIRKGSQVSLKGNLASFGESAACLSDCKLGEVHTQRGQKNDEIKP